MGSKIASDAWMQSIQRRAAQGWILTAFGWKRPAPPVKPPAEEEKRDD